MAINFPSSPFMAPIGATFFVAVSVAASGSITPGMAFRGLYIQSTVTLGIWGIDDVTASFLTPVIGQILWVAGRALSLTGSVAGGVIGIR